MYLIGQTSCAIDLMLGAVLTTLIIMLEHREGAQRERAQKEHTERREEGGGIRIMSFSVRHDRNRHNIIL